MQKSCKINSEQIKELFERNFEEIEKDHKLGSLDMSSYIHKRDELSYLRDQFRDLVRESC